MGKFLDTQNRDNAILKQTLTLAHFRGYFPSRKMNGNVRNLYGFVENSWVFLDNILIPESFLDEHTQIRAKITVEVDRYLRGKFKTEDQALDEVDLTINRAIPFSTGRSSNNPLDWAKLWDLTAPIYKLLLEKKIDELALISP